MVQLLVLDRLNVCYKLWYCNLLLRFGYFPNNRKFYNEYVKIDVIENLIEGNKLLCKKYINN